MSLLNLFVDVDDFCQMLTVQLPQPVLGRANRPGRKPSLAVSEDMTIVIYFHMSRYRDFKTYYTQYVMKHLRGEFPLITGLRKNMKTRLLALFDKLMLRKRALIETITDQLKNISQMAHTRHRGVDNFPVNLVAGLIAYCHQPQKSSLNLRDELVVLTCPL